MIKTTGAEWLKFLQDPKIWVGETYMDDTDIKINGHPDEGDDDKIKPTDVVTVEEGVILIDANIDKCQSLVDTFRKWKKSQSNDTLLVEIPKEKVDQLKAFLKTINGKFV